MSKKTYIIHTYDPATSQIERVTVTREVFNACRRSEWNIAKNMDAFFKHEIQMSSLIGGENGNYENFREFIVDHDEVDRIVAQSLLHDALHRALDALSDADYDLINATFFEGKTLAEYGAEKKMPVSTLCERRQRILRDLKKSLKKFSE